MTCTGMIISKNRFHVSLHLKHVDTVTLDAVNYFSSECFAVLIFSHYVHGSSYILSVEMLCCIVATKFRPSVVMESLCHTLIR